MASHRRLSRARAAAAAALALTAVVAGLHTRPGLRLLVKAGLACPVFLVTPAAASELRAEGIQALRGDVPAAARPALGLTLDRSTEADVRAWAARQHLACVRARRGFLQLTCRPAGDPGTAITLTLGQSGTLIDVDSLARPTTGAAAARTFFAATADLATRLGPPTKKVGDAASVIDAPRPWALATVQYRFRDYLASVSAQRLPSGLVVRQQYRTALP